MKKCDVKYKMNNTLHLLRSIHSGNGNFTEATSGTATGRGWHPSGKGRVAESQSMELG